MRKARVSLLAGGSLLTTWRRAVAQAASSGMSAAAPGRGVRGGAAPSHPTPGSGPPLTGSPQEGRVEAEGDQRLLEPPQKVLEHSAHHVDVGHAAEGGQRAPGPQQPPLPLPHELLRARHPVQPCLRRRERGSAPRGLQHGRPHHPGPYLRQASRLHLGHTLHHQRGHQGRRRGGEVSQHALGRTACSVPATQPCGRSPRVPGPIAQQPHQGREQPPNAAMLPLTSRGQAWW